MSQIVQVHSANHVQGIYHLDDQCGFIHNIDKLCYKNECRPAQVCLQCAYQLGGLKYPERA